MLDSAEAVRLALLELRSGLDRSRKLAEEYHAKVEEAESLAEQACKDFDARKKLLRKATEKLGKWEKTDGEDGALDEIRGLLDECKEDMAVVQHVRPETGSGFLRLFLGRVNVKMVLNRDRLNFKEEYNAFKYATNYGFVLFPLIWALVSYFLVYRLRYVHWIMNVTQVWLLYYFTSLALRENILRVNGSRIRKWWSKKHILSAALAIVSLAWPDSPLQREFVPYFTAYFLYQGIVQFLQGWYQSRRHYVLRSLGKASSMDPATTEGLQEYHSGLFFLVPLLFLVYVAQGALGIALLHAAYYKLNLFQPWWQYREEIQVVTIGLGFLLFAGMSSVVLVRTLIYKSSLARKSSNQPTSSSSSTSTSTSSTSTSPAKPSSSSSSSSSSSTPSHTTTPSSPVARVRHVTRVPPPLGDHKEKE